MPLLQLEDTGSESVVPLPNVHSRTLCKVLEYAQKHAKKQPPAEAEGDAPRAEGTSAADKGLDEWDKVPAPRLFAPGFQGFELMP